MRPVSLLFPFFLTACATAPAPYAPVDNVRYAAIGQDPFWMVTIGDDRIVLSLAGETGEAPTEAVWPRTLPRTIDGVRTWESGEGTQVITVESRPGPCVGVRGHRYRDHVRVRLSGRELSGCGGRLISDFRE